MRKVVEEYAISELGASTLFRLAWPYKGDLTNTWCV